MSSNHKYSLELSEEAYDDLVNIQNYTYTNFGEKGWKLYGEALDQCLLQVLEHPHSGHKRKDIPDKYLCWNVREHVLIYRIENEVIYVVRVLHKRMNFRFLF